MPRQEVYRLSYLHQRARSLYSGCIMSDALLRNIHCMFFKVVSVYGQTGRHDANCRNLAT
jgi:hypothetical protein